MCASWAGWRGRASFVAKEEAGASATMTDDGENTQHGRFPDSGLTTALTGGEHRPPPQAPGASPSRSAASAWARAGTGLQGRTRPPSLPCSLGDTVVTHSQPLGGPVNRPWLCDLPRGENSSCRQHPPPPSPPRSPGQGTGLLDKGPRGLGSRMGTTGWPPWRTLSKMPLYSRAPKTGLGWQAGTEGPLRRPSH